MWCVRVGMSHWNVRRTGSRARDRALALAWNLDLTSIFLVIVLSKVPIQPAICHPCSSPGSPSPICTSGSSPSVFAPSQIPTQTNTFKPLSTISSSTSRTAFAPSSSHPPHPRPNPNHTPHHRIFIPTRIYQHLRMDPQIF
jgi:hypothetical protein